jgi:tetratricopeptide (TPR) repeat protein
MYPYGTRRLSDIAARAPLLLMLLLLSLPLAAAPEPRLIRYFRPNDAATHRGFDHFYSLEYDKAIREFESSLQAHPEDPFAVNHLLTAVMFKEMYRIGALDSELYAKEGFLKSKQFPVDPKVKQRIHELMERSLALSEARLRLNSNDPDALYTRGVVRGLKSTYTGLIEKAWFVALRSAVGARRDHERVLELEPEYTDAKMIVGIHNYVLGSLSWPVKVAAAVVGLGGNKKTGTKYLYEASEAGGESSIDARIALSLFLRREQRYEEALELVRVILHSYPRNFLVALEEANLLNAAGHGPEAISAYRNILNGARTGRYAEPRLEMVHYGLAEALRGQRLYAAAAESYENVVASKETDPELRERATLGAGQMYDAIEKRDKALEKYRAVIALDAKSEHANIARRHMKQAYRVN